MNAKKSLQQLQIIGFVSLFLLVGGIGGWAYFSSIAGAVIAQATVVVESNPKEVQHLEGGIVAKLNVRNGDLVEAGEVLIRLDDTDTKASLEILNTQLYGLLARKARLEAERDSADSITFPDELNMLSDVDWVVRTLEGQRKLFASRREFRTSQIEQLTNQIVQLEEEITGMEAQLAAQNIQANLYAEELQGVQKLSESGLVTTTRTMTLERQVAASEGERGRLIAGIARIRAKIGETQLKIIQINQDAQTTVLSELREIQPRIAELYERRISARANLQRVDIVAPQAGFVHELQINGEGSVIGAGQVAMLIVPRQDALVLEARINPQDIDQISAGQKVVINFPAFASGVTPSLNGSVYRIAADLSQENGNTPPYYAVRIQIGQDELDKLEGQQLKPGMPAEAYVQTATRSALSYLVKPFTDQLNRAFRET
ncbi:MAG TPA: HlyD family type I secretion periplasmic adaptor subunit [Devosia sp.]|nr:HlyD family type I secretion periplasmic adaptor subunit [Devosia sp.]